MMRRLLVVAALLACAAPAGAWPWGHKTVRRYKVVSADGGQSILEGESIRTRGFYVEIILHGRVDTIVCGPKYVTELPPEKTEPAVAPESKPGSMLDPQPSREAKR